MFIYEFLTNINISIVCLIFLQGNKLNIYIGSFLKLLKRYFKIILECIKKINMNFLLIKKIVHQ